MSYCALLRGIMPSNPHMRSDKLRGVFTQLGFEDVSSVLSSGNIIFASDGDGDVTGLEDRIQQALRAELGIEGGTILRSRHELQQLVDRAPFGGLAHAKSTYLTVTFLKRPLEPVPDPFPTADMDAVRIVGYDPDVRAVLGITDTTAAKTPDFMGWLEREFTKDITTRTWLTITRILRKFPPRPG